MINKVFTCQTHGVHMEFLNYIILNNQFGNQ